MDTYKTNKNLEAVIISDVHIGNEYHNETFFDYAIDYIKKGKNRKWIYVGDGIENNLRDSPGNCLFQPLSPEEQGELWVKKIKPIRKKCIAYNGTSNHLDRTKKQSGISLEKLLAAQLDLTISKPIDFLELTIGDHTYDICHQHGASGGTTPGGRINAQRRFVENNEANIFIMGHLHMSEIRWTYKRTKHDTMIPKLQVTNGSFLDYIGGYGDIKNYSPSPAHFCSILFNKNHNIQTKTIYDTSIIEW